MSELRQQRLTGNRSRRCLGQAEVDDARHGLAVHLDREKYHRDNLFQ